MTWNYRIGVEKIKNPWVGDEWDGEDTHNTTYYVIKCTYTDDANPKPYNYHKVSLLQGSNEYELKIEVRKIVEAFKSPMLDLNDFPKEIKGTES